MSRTIVIIGGDAAGMSAAAKIKRELSEAEVIVFEKGPHISYSACGMPYWIGGIIDSDRKLVVMTPEAARKRRDIDVRIYHEVTSIDRTGKTVTVTSRDPGVPPSESSRTFTQSYDYLVIATGARASQPPIPGLDLSGIFTIRSLADGQRIYAYMAQHTVQNATIIGGGYIGVEMAEAMRERGIETTIVEMLPQLMPIFDSDMMENVTEHIRGHGVELHLASTVRQISQSGTRLSVEIERAGSHIDTGQETIIQETDLVIVATGVQPATELAAQSGLLCGTSGAIWVDATMRTSDPAIFAAGDCVEHHHLVTGGNAWVPLATSANKGGRLAGENIISLINGAPMARFPGILGTAVVKVFDYTLSTTGITEHEAVSSGQFGDEGKFVGAALIENPEKTGYWPGVETIQVKLVFDKRDGRVLGGQIAGKAGVNKRIDIIATAITARMTLDQIAMLDLSYAPPYSPTYDPIHICANVGQRDVNPALRFASLSGSTA